MGNFRKRSFFILLSVALFGCSSNGSQPTRTKMPIPIAGNIQPDHTNTPVLTPKPRSTNGAKISRVPTFTPTSTFTPTPYDWDPFWGCPGMGYPDKPVVFWFFSIELLNDEQLKIGAPLSRTFSESRPNTLCPLSAPDGSQYYVFYEEVAQNFIDLFGPITSSRYSSQQNAGFHNEAFGKNIDELWLDLTPLMEKSSAGAALLDPQQYDQSMIHARQSQDGKLLSISMSAQVSALQFNPVLFDRAGLNYPPAVAGEAYKLPDGSEVPWSWETVAQVARLLTVDSNGHNATQPDFDAKQIEQYGFTWGNNAPAYTSTYWGAGSLLVFGGSPGNYVAKITDRWKTAWQWTYDGLHGPQPFIAMDPEDARESRTYQRSWSFESGRTAMVLQIWNPIWASEQSQPFQFATIPSYQGKVYSATYTQNFYILNTSDHPSEAFSSLAYIIEHASPDLIVGSIKKPAIYENSIPARLADRQAYFDLQKQKYPWVTTWNTLLTGLVYTDQVEETYMPNAGDVWGRIWDFNETLKQSGIDLYTEEHSLENDLTAIFNQTKP